MRMENVIAWANWKCECVWHVGEDKVMEKQTVMFIISNRQWQQNIWNITAPSRYCVCECVCMSSNLLISINWSANSPKVCVIHRIKYVCALTRSLKNMQLNLWSSASLLLYHMCVRVRACKIWKMQPECEFFSRFCAARISPSMLCGNMKAWTKWFANTSLVLSFLLVESRHWRIQKSSSSSKFLCFLIHTNSRWRAVLYSSPLTRVIPFFTLVHTHTHTLSVFASMFQNPTNTSSTLHQKL